MPPEPHFLDMIRSGVATLLEAFACALDAGCDPWDFAVEISVLSKAGLTTTHLRWLARKGYIEHGVEYIPRGEDKRLFRSSGNWTFRKHSCFILTPEGRDFAVALLGYPPTPTPTDPPPRQPDSESPPAPPTSPPKSEDGHNGAPSLHTPYWNACRRHLLWGLLLVKEFVRPAPNQELLLSAFQEDGWEERIDDPLPPVAGVDQKRRLHDTIKALNHHQRVPCIHFTGDGTGNGIRWEVIVRPQLYLGGADAVLHDFRQTANGVTPIG